MTKTKRYQAFIDYFSEHQPNPTTELLYDNPFQLLVAVILSAQCTDKRVNIATRDLFEAFPTPAHLAYSDFEEVFPYIKSISYPNSKTKHLIKMSKMLIENFEGKIPECVEALQKLPGVGRKTANVVASVLYDQPCMAVDTHVFRVAKRIGLVKEQTKTPLEAEKQLVAHIAEKYISKAHHWLILHGRYVCVARKPKCASCQLSSFCHYFSQQSVSTID